MKCILNWINYYAPTLNLLLTAIIALISSWFIGVYKEGKLNSGDAALYVKNTFWRKPWWRKNPMIYVVHKFEKSSDSSGYKNQQQFTGSHQWSKIIDIKKGRNWLGFINYEIIPKNKEDVLHVEISRNGRERWKVIRFNMD